MINVHIPAIVRAFSTSMIMTRPVCRIASLYFPDALIRFAVESEQLNVRAIPAMP